MFTCVGRRVMLLKAFRKAMEELGIEGKIIATDLSHESAAMQIADVGYVVPAARKLQYIPKLEDLVREHNVGLLVPLTDVDLRPLSRHRDGFAKLGCSVMIGPEPTIQICRDKKRFSQHITRGGLPAIRTFSLGQFRRSPFYPCFTKPLRGSGGHGASIIHSGRELRKQVHFFGDQLLVQDYVPGREYTIDVYRTREGEIKSIVPRQRLLVRSGEVEQGVTIHDEELIASTRKLVGLLDGLWGVFCLQCRRPDGKEPFFFELNPRFGGGVLLSIDAGANLPLYLIQEVTGREITGKVGDFAPNRMLMRYSGDLFCDVDDPKRLRGFDSPIFK